MLQALEQSCLEAHLLEAAWVGNPVLPEAPGERLCRVGALSLAAFHAWGGGARRQEGRVQEETERLGVGWG